jgi:hypothetical protein
MRLQIGQREWTQAVGPDDKAVVFDVHLESSEATPLTARMLDGQGKEIANAFYVYVSRTRE